MGWMAHRYGILSPYWLRKYNKKKSTIELRILNLREKLSTQVLEFYNNLWGLGTE